MFKKSNLSDSICHYADLGLKWLIYLSIVLIPLVFLPQVNSVFTTPKLYVLRVITLLVILLWGVKGVFLKDIKFRWHPFYWFVIAYAGISILNTVFSSSLYSSLYGTYGRFIGIFTVLNLLFWAYVVFAEFKSKERIKKIIKVSVVTACVIAFYGLLQYFDLLVNIFPWTQNPQDRVFATIGHSNHTAAYLGMNLMLMLGLIFTAVKTKHKYLMWAGFGLMALTLVLTASRGGFFAVIFAGLVWLVYVLKTKKLAKKTLKYSIIGLIIAAVLGVVLSGPISKLGVVERTVSTITFIQQGNMPDRISWWLSSMHMVIDKPFLGHGLSTYKEEYNKYRRTDYRLPDDSQDQITPETAHNEYLNIAATQGIIGFAVYAAMIVMLFIYVFKFLGRCKDDKDKIAVLSLLAAVIVYLVEVSISFGTVMTLFFFYTILGLLVSYIQDSKETEIKNNYLYKLTTAIVVIPVLIFGFIFALNALLAEYHFKQAKNYTAAGDFENTILSYKEAIRLNEDVYKYYEDYGNFLFDFAIKLPEDLEARYILDAVEAYTGGIAKTQTASLFMNGGLAYSRIADLAKENDLYDYERFQQRALDAMEGSLTFMKNNPYYHYKYGRTLKYYKYYTEALEQFEKVLEIRNPYKDTQFLIEEVTPLLPPEEPSDESSDGDSEEQTE